MRDEFIWVEKYRPKTIDDCILPQTTKNTFKEFLKKGEIPNLLLSGPPGIGKTTVAKALCDELGVDCYVINGSDEGRFLDTVRNQAKNFASTVSLMDSDKKHKVIIIDEADNTTHDVQLLLRANIESFYKLSLIHISEPTRRTPISYAVFCLKKKKQQHRRRARPRPRFFCVFFFLMIRRPPRSTHCISSAASDVYKRQTQLRTAVFGGNSMHL